jgi:hypothetical protein
MDGFNDFNPPASPEGEADGGQAPLAISTAVII